MDRRVDKPDGALRRKVRWGWLAVAAVPAIFIGYFFAYPVVRILGLGLAELGTGVAGLETRLARVGWFTLWQATVSTLLTFLVAAPLTWAVSTYEFRGRRLATALVTVPFVMPTVVVGTAFELTAPGSLGYGTPPSPIRDAEWGQLAGYFGVTVESLDPEILRYFGLKKP